METTTMRTIVLKNEEGQERSLGRLIEHQGEVYFHLNDPSDLLPNCTGINCHALDYIRSRGIKTIAAHLRNDNATSVVSVSDVLQTGIRGEDEWGHTLYVPHWQWDLLIGESQGDDVRMDMLPEFNQHCPRVTLRVSQEEDWQEGPQDPQEPPKDVEPTHAFSQTSLF